jgi:hypothetical protein
LGSFGRLKAFERRFAESFGAYRQRAWELFDGIDIVKALANIGLADRAAVAKAVKETMRAREETPAPAHARPGGCGHAEGVAPVKRSRNDAGPDL